MKKLLAGVVAGLVLGSAGAAMAREDQSQATIRSNGVMCKAASGGMLCLRTNGTGYGTGITTAFVLVQNLDTGKSVLTRMQP